MVVTQIKPINNKKSEIYIDYEFAFVLYKGEIHIYKLSENDEIPQKTYEEIVKVLTKRVKVRAMHLLEKRFLTRWELCDKLKKDGYTPEYIDIAVEYLDAYNYLDDERYAKDFIGIRTSKYSKARITQDLVKKGVDKNLIESCFEELNEDGDCCKEDELISQFLAKKGYSQDMDKMQKQKLMAALFRKGFSMDNILRVMNATLDTYY